MKSRTSSLPSRVDCSDLQPVLKRMTTPPRRETDAAFCGDPSAIGHWCPIDAVGHTLHELTFVGTHMSVRSYVVAHETEARAVLLHGLADRSRLSLVEALARGARRVSDLVEETGLSQSNVSRHLACLWD